MRFLINVFLVFLMSCSIAMGKHYLVKEPTKGLRGLSDKVKIIKEFPDIKYTIVDVPLGDEDKLDGMSYEADQEVFAYQSDEQWALVGENGINGELAWNLSLGSNVVVAILDSGVDYTHEALKGRMWVNEKEIAGNGKDDDGNGYVDDVHGYNFVYNMGDPKDDNGHGTHCAGIVAANGKVMGIAPKAKIMALKFLQYNGRGMMSGAVEGVLYAANNGAHIINASFGGGKSDALEEAIKFAESKGVLFVAAAGNANTNLDVRPSYPGALSLGNLISVGSHDVLGWKSDFSNYGHLVHISAPGSNILSTYLFNQYKALSGTSMATPYVAGVAALIKARYPHYKHKEIKEALLRDKEDGKDNRRVHGAVKLDALRALE